jgi:hypothetical protein
MDSNVLTWDIQCMSKFGYIILLDIPKETTNGWVNILVGGPELKFSSSVTFFPIFGLTAVLKILSFPALALGDNIADL